MTYLMTLIGQPSIPGADGYAEVFPVILESDIGVGPDQFCVFGGCVDNPLEGSVEIVTPLPNGNIANFEDRWALIIQDTLPAFQDQLADMEETREIIGSPVGERIDDYRIDVDTIIDVLDNFEIDVNQ